MSLAVNLRFLPRPRTRSYDLVTFIPLAPVGSINTLSIHRNMIMHVFLEKELPCRVVLVKCQVTLPRAPIPATRRLPLTFSFALKLSALGTGQLIAQMISSSEVAF